MKLRVLSVAVATFFVLSGAALAETSTQNNPTLTPKAKVTTTPKAKTTPNVATKIRSEKSIACSAEADKRGLHGKERKKFRSTCKKGNI